MQSSFRSLIVKIDIGDWSNGMIGVSKTFGGSSILSSPAIILDFTKEVLEWRFKLRLYYRVNY